MIAGASAPVLLRNLLREGVAITRSQPLPTAVASLVVAAVCAVTLATVGQSAAAEARVIAKIDEAGTRTLSISDPTGQAGLNAESVRQVLALHGVEWALGVGPVIDMRNADLGAAGPAVPARRLYGALPPEIAVDGRPPAPGEALIGTRSMPALGAQSPVAGVRGDGITAAIVGSFTAQAPLAFLDGGVVITGIDEHAVSPSTTIRQLFVMARRLEEVDALAAVLRSVVIAEQPSVLVLQTPAALLELREAVGGELANSSRRLMLLVGAVGMVVVALTLGGAVSQRRRDFGRRRALGASRSMILSLVLIQAAIAAALGVVLGCGIGLVVVWRLTESLPLPTFVLGVASLALLASLVAGVIPGLLAALRDPVRILRVP